jgi:hypothetical protein
VFDPGAATGGFTVVGPPPTSSSATHNSSVASGNDRRVFEIFTDNLKRWSRGERLLNEVSAAN